MKEKNVNNKAVALQYNIDEDAPKVIGKGQGIVADNILEKAKEYNLPVYKEPGLVDELIHLEIGQEIPPEMYEIIAEILIFVDQLDKVQNLKER